jgi:regulator of chromosome condensation
LVQSLYDEEFRAIKVAAGDSVSVALGIKGELRVWGSFRVSEISSCFIFLFAKTRFLLQSSDGLLGFDGRLGSSKTQILPIPMPSLQPHEFIDIACGTDHILALSKNGFVYAWCVYYCYQPKIELVSLKTRCVGATANKPSLDGR